MKAKGWIFSGVFHAIIVVVAILGLPDLFDGESDQLVETVDVAFVEIDQVNSVFPEPEPVPEPEPAPEPEPVP